MTEDMQSLRNDIAYLKALADGGQKDGRQGGVILMAAGLLFGGASLVQWAALNQVMGVEPTASWIAWLVAMLGFFAVLILSKRRWRAEGSSAGSAGLAWQGVGMGCFCIFAGIAVATWRTQSPILINFAPSIIFVLYGAAWTVAAVATHRAWLHLTAWGSFAAALVAAWFIDNPANFLIYTAGLMLLAFLPGLILTLRAQRSKYDG